MTKCKYCQNTLYLTPMSGKCRTCGRKAGFFRSMGGTTTFTQKGAVCEINREIKAVERKMVKIQESSDREAARLLELPVTDGLHGMTWQAAEQLACKWMTKNGHWGAKLSPPGADGGIDVESLSAIAQVKHHKSPMGIGEMQRIYGIAQSKKKKALFFAATGYTAQALEWAKKHKIECYTYPPVKRVRA
ncbi:restriction endonuclease [Rhodococcus qingshengii]|uniref:restriction endonuclease n=1 Tax=Rhodococcus qingshengii TaxID=334542 RepID=UPI0036DE0BE6